jgi:hypothetical protein
MMVDYGIGGTMPSRPEQNSYGRRWPSVRPIGFILSPRGTVPAGQGSLCAEY